MFWYAQPGAALSPAMPVRCGCVALTSQQAQDKTPKHSKGSAWDMTQKVHISNVGEDEAEGTRCGVRSGICSRRGGEVRGSRVDQTGLKPQSIGQLSMCPPPTETTRIGQHKQEGQQQLEGRRVPVCELSGGSVSEIVKYQDVGQSE